MKICYSLLFVLLFSVSAFASGYKIDRQIGKDKLGMISHLAIGTDDILYALENDGRIICFNDDGSICGTIETGMKNTTAIATAANGEIHVFSTLTTIKKVKHGARMRTIHVPVGVECSVFDASGKKLKTIRLEKLKSAQAAKIIDGKLIVADLAARALVFLDLETAIETARITKGLRLCCGIFDFCEAPDHTIAVSNLGAFKVQRYNMEGKLVMEFGKRGRGLNDFQGCCNPVSAAYLPDGKILTVEKDPTRIKVYDANGNHAQQISGVEELVKGCSFIPCATDSKGNIYLAATTKGYIIKCVK
ncbi:MAG: hypothetical protein OES84_02865 [Kiritimatiellaceae bacterium]|nr:hypothetical protein [Kiritimatiellaceae bacterium]